MAANLGSIFGLLDTSAPTPINFQARGRDDEVSGIASGVAGLFGSQLLSRNEQKDEINKNVDINDENSLYAAAQAMLQFDTAQAAKLLQRGDAIRDRRRAQRDSLQETELLAGTEANQANVRKQQAAQGIREGGAFQQFLAKKHPDLVGMEPAQAKRMIEQREKDAANLERTKITAAAGERNNQRTTAATAAGRTPFKPEKGVLVTQDQIDALTPAITEAIESGGLLEDAAFWFVPGFKATEADLNQIAGDVLTLRRANPQVQMDVLVKQAVADHAARVAPKGKGVDDAADAKGADKIEAQGAAARNAIAAGWQLQADGTYVNVSDKNHPIGAIGNF